MVEINVHTALNHGKRIPNNSLAPAASGNNSGINTDDLKEHDKSNHGPLQYERTTEDPSQFGTHGHPLSVVHHSPLNPAFMCKVCGKTCEDQTSLKDHIDIVLSIHDQTLTNACYSCGIVFQS